MITRRATAEKIEDVQCMFVHLSRITITMNSKFLVGSLTKPTLLTHASTIELRNTHRYHLRPEKRAIFYSNQD